MSRSYVFTSFNEKPSYDPENIQYLVYQREKSPTTNKLHWQGYVEFYRTHRIPKAKKLIHCPTAHLEQRHGTRIEARQYCIKDDTQVEKPVEHGIWLKGQGHRSDLDELISRIKKGDSDLQLIDEDAEQYERYHRFVTKYRNLLKAEKINEYKKT